VDIGRIGDVINGEHYGPASNYFLAVRNTHPDALTPTHNLAYHSGGLYEVLLGASVFAIAWPLRQRLSRGPLRLPGSCSPSSQSAASSSSSFARTPRTSRSAWRSHSGRAS
jgi:prolipoprotein diacylglyceryltransferase